METPNERIIKCRLVKKELTEYAQKNDFESLKRVYCEKNEKMGYYGGWMLLADIFYDSCKTTNMKLLETVYELDEMNKAIRLDNNPSAIFQRTILDNNTIFFEKLISYPGPLWVLEKNRHCLVDFVVKHRCYFMPILQLMEAYNINWQILMIRENAFILYNREKRNGENKNYTNGEYVFIEYEIKYQQEVIYFDDFNFKQTENQTEQIPISVVDNQYIQYLESFLEPIIK